MKNIWKVGWKVVVTLIATVGALIILEAILTPFLRYQQIQPAVKIAADIMMAGIPLLLCLKLFKLSKESLGLSNSKKSSHFGVGAILGLGFILGQVGLMFILGGIELVGLRFNIGSLLLPQFLRLPYP
jgi:L-asparagine transporter-like permease